MGDRSVRHTDHRPTKEVFTAPHGGTDPQNSNGFSGYRLDTDADEARIVIYVPHDYGKMEELAITLIPLDALEALAFTVQVNYAKRNELHTMHGKTLAKSFTSNTNVIREIDITDLVDVGTPPLDARDYLGIIASRVAGQNTNALVIGARLKYQVK